MGRIGPMNKTLLAIGNFDGVHAGHQALLQQGAAMAKAQGLAFDALTFDPHPRHFFNPSLPPFLLTTLKQRIALLRQQGINHVWVENFDTAFYSANTCQKNRGCRYFGGGEF
jgi:riboflavin kinase / FMN adenylyltransferase